MSRTKPRLVEVEPVQSDDLVEAKLRPPVPRPGSVPRTALINRLRVAGSHPIVTVLAPAGYGKTTLLSQWADRETRAVAWVSLREGDDDPAVLSRYIEAAIDRAASEHSPEGSRALVLVLDDVHVLRSRRCARIVTELAAHLPDGRTLVLAGRALPRIPIARARAAGQVFELAADDLALSRREVSLLLRGVGLERPQADVAELAERTEGWAVGVYLGASAVGNATPRSSGPRSRAAATASWPTTSTSSRSPAWIRTTSAS